jgi:hypothetical protein
MLAAGLLLGLCGCPGEPQRNSLKNLPPAKKKVEPQPPEVEPDGREEVPVKTGTPVAFGVAACTNRDPAVAGRTAVEDAVERLGVPAKGIVFFEYFPKTLTATVTDAEGQQRQEEREVPDKDKERRLLEAVSEAAGKTPAIGCRARSLVAEGVQPADTVAVLAVGGDDVQCRVASVRLSGDRNAVGTALAKALGGAEKLDLFVAISEPGLAYDEGSDTSASDFVCGVLGAAGGKDVVLFGGGGMPDDEANGPGSVQFCGGKMLEGHVVALGIGGPIGVHASRAHEFTPAEETLKVTKSSGRRVFELDGRPAAAAYREVRGMEPDDEFTVNWQHPLGLVTGPDEVCLRMVHGEDRENGALEFATPIPEGSEVKVLFGGGDPQAILDSAGRAVSQSFEKAGDAKPLVVLAADSFARARRLREFHPGGEDQLGEAIASARGEHEETPIFGFCAYGGLGPVAGELRGQKCAYHQHTIVSVVVAGEK